MIKVNGAVIEIKGCETDLLEDLAKIIFCFKNDCNVSEERIMEAINAGVDEEKSKNKDDYRTNLRDDIEDFIHKMIKDIIENFEKEDNKDED